LLSRNRALRSFGLLADLGEVACITAALVALPALVRVFTRRD
jgi:predicted RND superfamily exporter protein